MAELKIDVQDLHKSYGDNEVLKGIDAKFYEGDVVCIIGPSGSGKSTFLRTLNLLETITSGKVIVDGYTTQANTKVDAIEFTLTQNGKSMTVKGFRKTGWEGEDY